LQAGGRLRSDDERQNPEKDRATPKSGPELSMPLVPHEVTMSGIWWPTGAGPFWITIDVFLRDHSGFTRAESLDRPARRAFGVVAR
jgi:hypothetical protein